jgi:alginate O-acetyltransferase complex protein AlgI
VLFNSAEFLFVFLPLVLVIVYVFGRRNQVAAKTALLLLSLGFYAWWRPSQLPLLLLSIVFNYIVGGLIQKYKISGNQIRVQIFLATGLVADVLFLGWFKYANFVADNLNWAFDLHINLGRIALPLAISFFTFQKIAYLIDSARGETNRISFLDFSLFAAFFPQLIAGPIVHFKEIVPQLQTRVFGRLSSRNVLIGLVMFSMGLFKKTVIADTLSAYSNPLYQAAAMGHPLGLASGWLAALGFSFQIYFDFSGYSDMAIGLGRMLGVKLPLNFHSPLRAANIIDYWRRWHMTLQRFIVAYIFQPLSLPLNRLAATANLQGWSAFGVGVAAPLLVTFLIMGLWHGAGWTYILFGAMHGLYITINEAWQEWLKHRRRRLRRAGVTAPNRGPVRIALCHGLTLVAVMFANVLFRSASVGDAARIWASMTGFDGLAGAGQGVDWGLVATLMVSALLVFLAPNSQQILGRFDPAYNWREWRGVARAPLPWTWKPNAAGLAFAGAALFLGVIFIERGRAVFLYFNF